MLLRYRIEEIWRKVRNFTYNVYKWRNILCNDYDWDQYYTYNALYFKICCQIKWFEKNIKYYMTQNPDDYNRYCRDAQSLRHMKLAKRLLEITYLESSEIDNLNLPKFNIRNKDCDNYIKQRLEEDASDINNTYLLEYIYKYRCKKILHNILLEWSECWWD